MAWVMAAFCVALMVFFAAGRAVAAPFAAVVMDARSGEILHARNHDTRLHPASLTKMMTLYVAFEAIGNGEITLDTMVTVSRRAASEPPSRLGLRAGQRIALRHLIRASAIRSGNDAATALAEAISGSVEAFTARMNRTAAAIGMNNTRFLNAHGLTEVGHYSTARDMTILGRQLYFDYPQYYNLFSRRSEHAGVAHVRNTNTRFLDSYRGADGIKTGFTRAAGYNLTASAERNGVRVIVTVFGGRSVADRHQRVVELMNMGFERAPARVAVRRPSRPQYSDAPGVAQASGQGQQGAGRVVRLRTAPARSPMPVARPRPDDEAPAADALLAALQEEVDAVLAEVAIAPSARAAPEESVPAPVATPLPPPRPGDDGVAEEPEPTVATRAASSPAQERHRYLGDDPGDAPPTAAAETAGQGDDARAEADPVPTDQVGQQEGVALSEVILPGDSLAALPDPLDTLPVSPPAPRRFEHSAEELGPVIVRDGLVVVPGLPPVVLDQAAELAGQAESAAAPDPLPAQPLFVQLASLQEALRPEVGQIESQDIVLTASDSEPAAAEDAPLARMVVRAAPPGSGRWTVRLGDFPSRFDAERTLLRVVLSESSALGVGERRVEQRAGRFVANIGSLTHEQAERACQRLSARAQNCEVIAP
ncbi:MAG: serine hydrolase [Pararhodobacter sp.]|nr:serine hydrolase [Pararhodobacter sp.]